MNRIGLAGALALSMGCPGEGPPPAQPVAVPVPVTTAPPVVDAGAPPVAPPPSGPTPVAVDVAATPAPWLEPGFDDPAGYDPLHGARTLSWGKRSALFVDRLGPDQYGSERYGVDSAHGAIGPLPLPQNVIWTGLGGTGDQVFVAFDDGTLLAAADLRAVAAGKLARVGAVPGARMWASAPGIIAAAVGDAVAASTDGGRKFRSTVVMPGKQVVELYARHDRVLVARVDLAEPKATDPLTLLSKGGGVWKKSKYQPWGLTQKGGWIAGASGCPAAVLSADGTHWVKAGFEAGDELKNEAGLGELLAHADTAWPRPPNQAFISAVKPSLPRYVRANEVLGHEPCDHGVGGSRGAIGQTSRRGTDLLRNVRGTAGPQLPATATSLALLADGACAARDIDRADPGSCRQDAPYARIPHVLAWNQRDRKPRILDAPAGCVPVNAVAEGGLALLGCAQGAQTGLFALTAAGTWVADGLLAAPTATVGKIGQAADGTIVISACQDQHCRAFVRAPRAAGDPTAWREIGGGEVYRALPGGAALVISAEPGTGEAMRIAAHVDHADGKRITLARGVALTALVTSIEISGKTIVIKLSPGGRHTIATDGTLVALPD